MPRKIVPLPPLEDLNKQLRYDYATGSLFWRRNEKRAGYTDKRGYVYVRINDKLYLAHRVIWKLHYKHEPPPEIDHKDGDPSNNTIPNLRKASTSQNHYNRKHTGKTPHKGVHFSKRERKYKAYIDYARKRKSLGTYAKLEDAIEARNRAALELHKEFVRLE